MDDPLTRALDHLYGVDLDAFVAERKRLAAELRATGHAAQAKTIAGAAKPTRSAWALNQVARRSPELLQALLRARDEAATPPSGDPDRLRQAMRDYRDSVGDVLRAAREVLAGKDTPLTAEASRRLTETLHAACAEPGDARERLTTGTLVADLVVDDPFAGVAPDFAGIAPDGQGAQAQGAPETDDGPEAATARPRTPEPMRRREQDRREQDRLEEQRAQRRKAQALREAALREARARIADLQAAAHDADVKAQTAREAADRAMRDADRARQTSEEAASRLAAAREELRRLEHASE